MFTLNLDGEGAWQGVWPSGRMFGKKGDILKLLSRWLELFIDLHSTVHSGHVDTVYGIR